MIFVYQRMICLTYRGIVVNIYPLVYTLTTSMGYNNINTREGYEALTKEGRQVRVGHLATNLSCRATGYNLYWTRRALSAPTHAWQYAHVSRGSVMETQKHAYVDRQRCVAMLYGNTI